MDSPLPRSRSRLEAVHSSADAESVRRSRYYRARSLVSDFAAPARLPIRRKAKGHVTSERATVPEPGQLCGADRVAAENARQDEIEHRCFGEQAARRESEHGYSSDARDPEQAPRMRRHALTHALAPQVSESEEGRVELVHRPRTGDDEHVATAPQLGAQRRRHGFASRLAHDWREQLAAKPTDLLA